VSTRLIRGFLGACFVALDDGQGVSIGVFETEAQAKGRRSTRGCHAPGVTLDALQFGEVIGAV
jgi:hypothetical protein